MLSSLEQILGLDAEVPSNIADVVATTEDLLESKHRLGCRMCLRGSTSRRSAVFVPSSCPRKIPMICPSANRFRFIVWSSFRARLQFSLDKTAGQRQPGQPGSPVKRSAEEGVPRGR